MAVIDLKIDSFGPPLSTVTGKLAGLQVAAFPWDKDGRHWRILAPVGILTKGKNALLEVRGEAKGREPLLLETELELGEGGYDVRDLNVPKRYVDPPPRAKKRAKKERKALQAILKKSVNQRLWRGNFHRPVMTPETSPFGTERRYNNKKTSRHLGWDLDGKRGDPIVATASGRVVHARDLYYSGGTLILDHGQGLFSLYFHMSAFDVKEGQVVEKGEQVGRVGASGRVTGPHLHFAFKLGGVYVSPQDVLALDFSEDPLDQSGSRDAGAARAVNP
jgi:murein DD-endopeptidase MepM/ murein hydrolase activator NlpD